MKRGWDDKVGIRSPKSRKCGGGGMASRYAIPVPSRFCLPGFAGVMGRPFACMFLTLLAGRHSESTPGNYCCFFPLLWVFLWMYRLISVVTFSWTENGQEWTWCCSRMDIRVGCMFSLSVFFVVVCTLFICAVIIWAPKHFCATTGWIFDISLCENSIINQP